MALRRDLRWRADRWRRLAVVGAVLITAATIGGYVAVSFTVNGLPPYPAAGWVTVLQPAAESDADIVQVLVQAQTDGSQTRAGYDVVVCGPRPYSGDLLIGGNARFAVILRDPLLPRALASPRVQRVSDLSFYFGRVISLGAVQVIHVPRQACGTDSPV